MAPSSKSQRHYGIRNSLSNIIIALGLIQLVIGILVVTTQIILILRWDSGYTTGHLKTPTIFLRGNGIWCGIAFAVTGIFGIVTSVRQSRPFFLILAVLSLVTFASSILLMIISGFCVPYSTDAIIQRNLFATQAISGIIQVASAIAIFAITLKILCKCSCCSKKKDFRRDESLSREIDPFLDISELFKLYGTAPEEHYSGNQKGMLKDGRTILPCISLDDLR